MNIETDKPAESAEWDPEDYVWEKFDFYGAHSNVFKLGVSYVGTGKRRVFCVEVVEDENDGYRSAMDVCRIVPDPGGFFDQPIAKVMVKRADQIPNPYGHEDSPHDFDGYQLADDSGHVWLTFGTDTNEDYYPRFTFDYTPDRLAGVPPEPESHSPAVVTRIDLNRYALEHILPGAAELCDEGKLAEVKAERDKRTSWEHDKTYWLAEVEPGVWETIDKLPHGLPPIRMHTRNPLGANGAHWQYANMLMRYRIVRDRAKALKLARETKFRVSVIGQ